MISNSLGEAILTMRLLQFWDVGQGTDITGYGTWNLEPQGVPLRVEPGRDGAAFPVPADDPFFPSRKPMFLIWSWNGTLQTPISISKDDYVPTSSLWPPSQSATVDTQGNLVGILPRKRQKTFRQAVVNSKLRRIYISTYKALELYDSATYPIVWSAW